MKKLKFGGIFLLLITGVLFFTWDSFYITRVLIWNNVSIEDYKIFPRREIAAPKQTYTFPKDTLSFRKAGVNENFKEIFGFKNVASVDSLMKLTKTTAFLVLKDDTLIQEKYYNGYNRSSINTSFSTAKSVTSALVGIAIDEGRIHSVNDPITKYIAELEGEDYKHITIEDLMTMSSGIAYDEESVLFGDEAKAYYEPDLREYALGFSIEQAPGKSFEYNNINPLLIGIILERSTGMNVSKYLETKIWKPLGMEFPASWSLDNNGFEKMESGLNGRAIDFLKFGKLYLDRGEWMGKQIISKDYVRESTTVSQSDSLLQNLVNGRSYKYFWWIYPRQNGKDDFFAEGNLGQFIYISPETNTVIVRHGKMYGFGKWAEFFYTLTNILSRNL